MYGLKNRRVCKGNGVIYMFKGFYTAASGMITQQRRTEMLTNNLANANTPGFKADQSSVRSFPELLLERFEHKSLSVEKGLNFTSANRVGSITTGVYVQEFNPLFTQGDMKETNLNTDIALVNMSIPPNGETGEEGAVFFTVENGAGEIRYTRNGHFTLDGQGFLTTGQGFYVLDENNQRIQLNSDDFTVNKEGYILQNNGQIGRLGIAFSDTPSAQLVKEGDGLFRADGGALPNAYTELAAGYSFSIHQGWLEGANVDEGQTMTEMLTAYRSFEANQKVLQAYDRSMDKAANEIGRI